MRKHNIGPGSRFLSHSEWLAYMERCALAWEAQRCPGQAANVRAQAKRHADERTCSVCSS